MKYFTPEHYLRGNSRNEDEVRGIEEDWERALQAYRRRWNRIRHAFPKGVQRFTESHICLHDAQVLTMTRNGNKFIMVCQREPPSRDLAILTFVLAGEPEIDSLALPGCSQSRIVVWLYEEWDLDRRGQFWFEVLLSNGWSIRLPFRDFHYLMGEQLLPTTNGQAAPGRTSTARSAS